MPSATASKLYGILNFLEQGIGRIGTGGLHALKERQNETGRELTRALRHTFETIRSVLRLRPQREVEILPSLCERFAAASDVAEDTPRQGTGGFLLVWGGEYQFREAFVAEITEQTYEAFLPGEATIAQLELSMVLFALTSRASAFRRRRGVWYMARLMDLIRGRSDSPDLERLANLIHVALFSLETWIYRGWIPSKSNWADAISRLGEEDPWCAANGLKLHRSFFPSSEVWSLPLVPAMLVFQYL